MIHILQTLTALFVFTILVAPIVMLTILLLRGTKTKTDTPKVSIDQIAQLEQNDSIIVEDINEALSAIAGRLEAIEERLDREENTVKGFANKKNQSND
jgi:hypothetical protein